MAVATNTYVLNKPEVQIPYAWEKFDEEGNPLDDSISERIGALLVALLVWTRRLKE